MYYLIMIKYKERDVKCPKCKSEIQVPRHSLIDKGRIIQQIYVCHDCKHDWVWKK